MKFLWAIARWALTLGLLGLALYQAPLQEWIPQLRHMHPGWVLLSALSMAAIVCVNSWKWHILLKVQGMHPGYVRVLYHYAVGYFFNSFITGTGDIKRATDMGQEQNSMPQAMASVLAERWTGVIGQIGLACCTISMVLFHTLSVWPIAITAVCIVIVLFVVYMWFEKAPDPENVPPHGLLALIYRIRQAMAVYKGHRRIWWRCVAISFVGPSLLVLIHITLSRALGFAPNTMAMIIFIPTISVFAQLPITINGFGIQDYFMVTLFQDTFSPAQAMALSMAFHALRLCVGACGGILFALFPNCGLKDKNAEASSAA